MFVAICQMQLSLGGVSSLKQKRSSIKSVTVRLGQKFRLATAEVGHHAVWQTAGIACAAVHGSPGTAGTTQHSRPTIQ